MGISLSKDCWKCGRIFRQAISDDYAEYNCCEKCEQNKMTKENPTISNEMTIYRQNAIQKEPQGEKPTWSWWDRICWFLGYRGSGREVKYVAHLKECADIYRCKIDQKIINSCKDVILAQMENHFRFKSEMSFIEIDRAYRYTHGWLINKKLLIPSQYAWESACKDLNLYYDNGRVFLSEKDFLALKKKEAEEIVYEICSCCSVSFDNCLCEDEDE